MVKGLEDIFAGRSCSLSWTRRPLRSLSFSLSLSLTLARSLSLSRFLWVARSLALSRSIPLGRAREICVWMDVLAPLPIEHGTYQDSQGQIWPLLSGESPLALSHTYDIHTHTLSVYTYILYLHTCIHMYRKFYILIYMYIHIY